MDSKNKKGVLEYDAAMKNNQNITQVYNKNKTWDEMLRRNTFWGDGAHRIFWQKLMDLILLTR